MFSAGRLRSALVWQPASLSMIGSFALMLFLAVTAVSVALFRRRAIVPVALFWSAYLLVVVVPHRVVATECEASVEKNARTERLAGGLRDRVILDETGDCLNGFCARPEMGGARAVVVRNAHARLSSTEFEWNLLPMERRAMADFWQSQPQGWVRFEDRSNVADCAIMRDHFRYRDSAICRPAHFVETPGRVNFIYTKHDAWRSVLPFGRLLVRTQRLRTPNGTMFYERRSIAWKPAVWTTYIVGELAVPVCEEASTVFGLGSLLLR
jgi:hypothetical protein